MVKTYGHLCHPVLTKQRVSYLYLVFLKSELIPTSVLSPFPIVIHCR